MRNARGIDPLALDALSRQAQELSATIHRVAELQQRHEQFARIAQQIEAQYDSPAVRVLEAQFQQMNALSPLISQDMLNIQRKLDNVGQLHLLGLQPDVARRMNEEAAKWQRITEQQQFLLAPLRLQMPLCAMPWELGFSIVLSRAEDLQLLQTHPLLSADLLDPYLSFSRFSRGKTELIAKVDSSREQAAVSGSLAVLGSHVVATAEIVESTLVVPASQDEHRRRVQYSILEAVQEDLRTSPDVTVELELDDLRSLSPSSRLGSQAQRIVRLLTGCNEATKVRGNEEIFKPTTRLIVACSTLPLLVARGRASLANVVDALFFMLFEAAGDDSLRFLSYVDREQARVVWAIKHLRNYYFRHDPDHGSAGKLRTKWSSLGESLTWLGLERLPRRSDECRRLQNSLYREVEAFLEHLLQVI